MGNTLRFVTGPMGRQIEIHARDARAVVTEVGAGLRAFEVGGVPYSETFGPDEEPPLGCGQILFPWPNRLAGGRWRFDGQERQLEINEVDRGNAIHGLVRHKPWRVQEHTSARVMLGTEVDEQAGWPVRLFTSIAYEVDTWGLLVTHFVRNDGDRTVPFGLGVHPYPRPGHDSLEDCDLQLAASTVLPLDGTTMLPFGDPEHVAGTQLDLRRGQLICSLGVDNAFSGLEAGRDGVVRHSIIRLGTSRGVELWAEKAFKWVQAFTADHFPGPRYLGVAIEPMTCPPDALNSGVDLIYLEPGQEWTARWGIRPLR